MLTQRDRGEVGAGGEAKKLEKGGDRRLRKLRPERACKSLFRTSQDLKASQVEPHSPKGTVPGAKIVAQLDNLAGSGKQNARKTPTRPSTKDGALGGARARVLV